MEGNWAREGKFLPNGLRCSKKLKNEVKRMGSGLKLQVAISYKFEPFSEQKPL